MLWKTSNIKRVVESAKKNAEYINSICEYAKDGAIVVGVSQVVYQHLRIDIRYNERIKEQT